jgi:hypothetical protein
VKKDVLIAHAIHCHIAQELMVVVADMMAARNGKRKIAIRKRDAFGMKV